MGVTSKRNPDGGPSGECDRIYMDPSDLKIGEAQTKLWIKRGITDECLVHRLISSCEYR
jgi:hypothetical protein